MAKVTNNAPFVTTVLLKRDGYTQSILRKRFFAAQEQYNVLLGEILTRLYLTKANKSIIHRNVNYMSKNR